MRGGARARLPLPFGHDGGDRQRPGHRTGGRVRAVRLRVAIFSPTTWWTDRRQDEHRADWILLSRVEVLAVGTQPVGQARRAHHSHRDTAPRTGSLMLTVAVDQADAEPLIEGGVTAPSTLDMLTDSVEVKPGTGVDNTDGGAGSVPLFK